MKRNFEIVTEKKKILKKIKRNKKKKEKTKKFLNKKELKGALGS